MERMWGAGTRPFFEFRNEPEDIDFKCTLVRARCIGVTLKGARCKRNTIKYVNRCYNHARSELGLVVKKSTIPGAGLGLFTTVARKRGDIITEYVGEVVDDAIEDERYGNTTAPYSLEVSKNRVIDPACKRGIGSYANHNPQSTANAGFAKNSATKGAVIRARKAIKAGNEVFVNYGPDFRMAEPGVSYRTKPYDK
jgi:SET domain-containing protein